MPLKSPVPVIDLFAGPGGLGEGFSSLKDEEGNPRFSLRVSIEKDPIAHKTLSLRALFRAFPKNHVPEVYYRYIRGEISRDALFKHPDIPPEALAAAREARNAELGKDSTKMIDQWIKEGIGNASEWVLSGGPPCQAYSIVISLILYFKYYTHRFTTAMPNILYHSFINKRGCLADR